MVVLPLERERVFLPDHKRGCTCGGCLSATIRKLTFSGEVLTMYKGYLPKYSNVSIVDTEKTGRSKQIDIKKLPQNYLEVGGGFLFSEEYGIVVSFTRSHNPKNIQRPDYIVGVRENNGYLAYYCIQGYGIQAVF